MPLYRALCSPLSSLQGYITVQAGRTALRPKSNTLQQRIFRNVIIYLVGIRKPAAAEIVRFGVMTALAVMRTALRKYRISYSRSVYNRLADRTCYSYKHCITFLLSYPIYYSLIRIKSNRLKAFPCFSDKNKVSKYKIAHFNYIIFEIIHADSPLPSFSLHSLHIPLMLISYSVTSKSYFVRILSLRHIISPSSTSKTFSQQLHII